MTSQSAWPSMRKSKDGGFRTGVAKALAAGILIGAMTVSAGAFAQTQTPANEPVPAWAQASWNAYLALKAKAHGGTQYSRANYSKMPDWTGVWTRAYGGLAFDPKQAAVLQQGDISADMTPRYSAAYLVKLYKVVAKGDQWDQLSDCLPAGYPRFLTEPFLMEFVVTPKETWWLREQQSEARRFYTDGRGHIPMDQGEANPLWDGDSVAFWDGDTLVVHTLYVTHGQYQRLNPDYSTQTSTLEKIRKVGDMIQDDVTVWDPKGLKKPWHVVDYYKRVMTPNIRINMWSCDANNNVVRTPTGGSTFILPGEVRTVKRPYREPQSFYLTEAQETLFNTDKPISITPEQKHWLRVNLKNPARYVDFIGPVQKNEMKDRDMAMKKMAEEAERMKKMFGGGDEKKK